MWYIHPTLKPIFAYILILLLCLPFSLSAQEGDSLRFDRRKKILTYSAAAVYGGSMFALNQAWYKKYPRSRFHFFDDAHEWLQMDKAGHVYTSYHLGRLGIESMQWAGFDSSLVLWIGSQTGMAFLTSVEILDGYSAQWGFSFTDMAANMGGMLLVLFQHLEWQEQRLLLKFSYQKHPFTQYRPEMFGSSLPENVLKDYNGQTYWLSANLPAFLPNKKLPAWLCLSFGYKGSNMIGGLDNDDIHTYIPRDADMTGININRQRQYYLSLDVDFSKIPVKSKALKTAFSVLNMVKIPAPAIEWKKGYAPVYHAVYF